MSEIIESVAAQSAPAGEAAAPAPSETAAEKPRRGRKPKAAQESEAAVEAASEKKTPKKKAAAKAADGAAAKVADGAAVKAAASVGTAAEPAAEAGAAGTDAAPKKRGRKAKAEKAGKAAEGSAPAEGAAAAAPVVVEAPASAAPASVSVSAEAVSAGEPAGASAPAGEPAQERAGARMRRSRRVMGREGASDSAEPADKAAASDQSGEQSGFGEGKKFSNDHGKNDKRKNRQNGENRQNGNGKQNGQQNGQQQNKQNNQQRNDRNDRHQRRQQRNQNREVAPSVTKEELAELKVADLRAKAVELGIDGAGIKKPELVDMVFDAAVKAEGFIEVQGILDIMPDGYGFLRTQGYLPAESDCYVSTSLIRRNNLRKGDMVRGQTRPVRENEKYAAIQKIIAVNDVPVEQLGMRPKFADLTPVYPDERLLMEHGKNTLTARTIDLTAPIGKGQRGLIVSPPKAGKTTVLKDVAAAITANNPEVHLMCLLVDERPEEVTDMQRSVRGEVVSSTFDMPAENHIVVAELVIERAKRLVEMGQDVVILLDSITRLARAYNLAQPASGRILSGGVDSTALYPPKRFLGAARNIEGGGSLTILGTALIDTGSKMDEVIFEEFKGTGNMELKLDRNLADRRIFPAIDPVASGTRKEELLLDSQEAPLIWAVRRILANMNNTERAMDMLIKSLKQTNTNQEFLIRTAKKAQSNTGKNDSLEL